LCSRIVASRPPTFDHARNIAKEMTATGIEALTVMPTFNTRYSDDAPKIIPSTAPVMTARAVNSRITVAGEIKGSGIFAEDMAEGVAEIVRFCLPIFGPPRSPDFGYDLSA